MEGHVILKNIISNEIQIEELKQLRKSVGLTQREICEVLGIPIRTWEDWESGRRTMPDYTLRMLSYYIHMKIQNNNDTYSISIIKDEKNRNIVVINDVRFRGRQGIKWEEVEKYLLQYVGESYEILETADIVYIGSDFPAEFKGSEDTKRLKGTQAKAKANSTLEIPLLLKYATNKRWQENYKSKHKTDAKHGWYRFTTRFALPVYTDDNSLSRYNIFRIEMLIRHASDGKLYLYDMVNVKKEAGTPPQH